jgi:LacI family transcriptional regulator
LTLTRRVRMIDVADAAGVSRTTASFVLNGREAAIPPETQQRVLEVAHRMGYHPHAGARALATGKTNRIAIVLNDPDSFGSQDMYLTRIMYGIMRGAVRRNCNILLHSAQHPDWRALYRDILSGTTDGVLLVGRSVGDELTPALLEARFPTVCLSFHVDHPRCYAVDCDNETGAYLALKHLVSLGHRQIAFVYPGQEISWGRERYQGACRALDEAGLSAANLHVHHWQEKFPPKEDWFLSAIEFLKTAQPSPTALVCCEESRVRHLVELLPGVAIRVPEDLSVISFNSTEISERSRPPLTSVWQSLDEVGDSGVEVLMKLIANEAPEPRIHRVPMKLDVRESCLANAQFAVVTA